MLRFLGRCVLACAAVVASGTAAGAQDSDPVARYVAAIDSYRAGTAAAARDVASWPPADLERLIPAAAARGTAFAQAAAVLHVSIAIDSAATDWTRGAAHLAASAALVQSLPADAEMFVERYYALVPTLFLEHGDLDGARGWVERGLQLFQFSAPIRTVSGMVEELLAHMADPECAGAECPTGGARAMVPERLRLAAREYQRALQRDPTFTEARLRLGRVLALSGKDDDAMTELAAVVSAGSSRHRYLAHLFLGAIAARRGDIAAARREYEAAMAAGPGRQTSALALSHLEERSGNVTRAKNLLAPLARMDARDDPDPWWSYQNGGVDREVLAWLVAYVRQ